MGTLKNVVDSFCGGWAKLAGRFLVHVAGASTGVKPVDGEFDMERLFLTRKPREKRGDTDPVDPMEQGRRNAKTLAEVGLKSKLRAIPETIIAFTRAAMGELFGEIHRA